MQHYRHIHGAGIDLISPATKNKPVTTQSIMLDDTCGSVSETYLIGTSGISPERMGRHVLFAGGCVFERIFGFTPLGDIVPVILRVFPVDRGNNSANVFVFKEGLKAYSVYPKGLMFTEEYEWRRSIEGIPPTTFVESYMEVVGRFSSFDAFPYPEGKSDRISQIRESVSAGFICSMNDGRSLDWYLQQEMKLLPNIIQIVNNPISREELWRDEDSEIGIVPKNIQCSPVCDAFESRLDIASSSVSDLSSFHGLAVSILSLPATDGVISVELDRNVGVIQNGDFRSRYFSVPNVINQYVLAVLGTWVKTNCEHATSVTLEWSSTHGRALLSVKGSTDFHGVIDLWACAALTQDLICV